MWCRLLILVALACFACKPNQDSSPQPARAPLEGDAEIQAVPFYGGLGIVDISAVYPSGLQLAGVNRWYFALYHQDPQQRSIPQLDYPSYPDLIPILNNGQGQVQDGRSGQMIAAGCFGFGHDARTDGLFLIATAKMSIFAAENHLNLSFVSVGRLCIDDGFIISIDDLDPGSEQVASLTNALAVFDQRFFDMVTDESAQGLGLSNAVAATRALQGQLANEAASIRKAANTGKDGVLPIAVTKKPTRSMIDAAERVSVDLNALRMKRAAKADPVQGEADRIANTLAGVTFSTLDKILQVPIGASVDVTSDLKFKKIASGGDGNVYKVDSKNPGEGLVIKISKNNGPQSLVDYANEVRMAWRAQGSGVAEHLSVGQIGARDSHPFIVMKEYDHDLQARIKEGGISIDDAYGYMDSMAIGLNRLHKSGAIHGDFKPLQVLMRGKQAHVSDFGQARDVAFVEPRAFMQKDLDARAVQLTRKLAGLRAQYQRTFLRMQEHIEALEVGKEQLPDNLENRALRHILGSKKSRKKKLEELRTESKRISSAIDIIDKESRKYASDAVGVKSLREDAIDYRAFPEGTAAYRPAEAYIWDGLATFTPELRQQMFKADSHSKALTDLAVLTAVRRDTAKKIDPNIFEEDVPQVLMAAWSNKLYESGVKIPGLKGERLPAKPSLGDYAILKRYELEHLPEEQYFRAFVVDSGLLDISNGREKQVFESLHPDYRKRPFIRDYVRDFKLQQD